MEVSASVFDLHSKWNPPTNPTHLSFTNRAVLITGANSGLGHEAAVKYAAQGANPLILGVRSEEKGRAAKAAIVARSGCAADAIVFEMVDLESFASVKAFVERVKARYPKLNVVQLVAGTVRAKYRVSVDGWEETLQVNVLSTALMGILLLPLLRAAVEEEGTAGEFIPHLSFLSSNSAMEVTDGWIPRDQTLIERLNDPMKWNPGLQYWLSKCAGFFCMRGLAERNAAEGWADKVVINATCSALCKTNLAKDFSVFERWLVWLIFFIFGRTAEEGARTVVSATGLGPESNGRLWRNDQFIPASAFMQSERGEETYHKTWEEVLVILKDYI